MKILKFVRTDIKESYDTFLLQRLTKKQAPRNIVGWKIPRYAKERDKFKRLDENKSVGLRPN